MACINPDGTLTATAEKVLKSLTRPGSVDDINCFTGLPTYQIRASLRELVAAGLLEEDEGRYKVTEAGLARLKP